MRVILKPAGAIIVALTVSSLAILAVSRVGKSGSAGPNPVEAPPPADAATTSSDPTETRTVFVNMDTVGGHDWVIWRDVKSTVRKATKTPIIGDLEVTAGQSHPFSSSVRTFSWSDGKPEAKGNNAGYGLQVAGVGNGFHFSVPALTDTARTLRVYTGNFHGGGDFVAKLSDGSGPERIDTAEVVGAGGHTVRLYTIRFKAKHANQKLDVSWSMGGGNGDGFITIQAAALE